MIQSGGFLGRLLGPLLKTGLPLIKNVIKPLTKSVLIPLGLTAAASLGTNLLGDLLTGKGIYRAGKGRGIVRAGYGNNSNNKMDF